MDASSERSPNTSSPRPDRPSGFFIRSLPQTSLGRRWDPLTAARVSAQPFVSDMMLSEDFIVRARNAFWDGGRVPHLFLKTPLQEGCAQAIRSALGEARFVRHHHAAYPLHIAPLDKQEPSGLTQFMRWLGSKEAARFHTHLVGMRACELDPVMTQVQASRMQVGEFFPPHVDTDAEALACVYNFTTPWEPHYGGQLEFPHPNEDRAEITVPVLFNSAVFFRSRSVRHRVLPVTEAAAGHFRYTITVFYVYTPEPGA